MFVQEWLDRVPLGACSRGKIKALLHRLFQKAMLWEYFPLGPNPMALVEVPGSSRRGRRPTVLTVEQYCALLKLLPEPYHTMVIVAQCLGLRVSEILALQWQDIDFGANQIVVRGAKAHQTGCINSHWIVVMPTAFLIGTHWGLAGVGWAWMIAYPIVAAPMYVKLYRMIDLRAGPYLRSIWPATSAALLMSALVLVVRVFLPSGLPIAARLAAQVVAGGLTYVGTIWFLHRARVRAVWSAMGAMRRPVSGGHAGG